MYAAAPKDDPSVKTVIGTVIEENAVVRRTNVGGMSFVGVCPSQGKVYLKIKVKMT